MFGGTPPKKPLKCKFVFALAGKATDGSGAHATGDDSKLVLARFSWSPMDIIEMSLSFPSQTIHLSFQFVCFNPENKKPCLRPVSRVKKFYFDSLPACLRFIHIGRLPGIRSG